MKKAPEIADRVIIFWHGRSEWPQKCANFNAQNDLLAVQNGESLKDHRKMVGAVVEILVEGPSKKNSARMTGRTRCNKIVLFDGSERHRGQLMDVRITRTGSFTLYGDPAIVNL